MTTPSHEGSPFSDEFEPKPRFIVEQFSEGKDPSKTEDLVGYNEHTLVISDGATDKNGVKLEQNDVTGAFKTGGEVAARLVVEAVLDPVNQAKFGVDLVRAVTEKFRDYYAIYNPAALDSEHGPAARFEATMIAATIVDDILVVTQVGDSLFRVNETDIYRNDKKVDSLRATERATEIKRLAALRPDGIPTEEDIQNGRAVILDTLKVQYLLCNNPTDPLGYSFINGTDVPEKFIKVYSFPLADVKTLELVSDGYYGQFPKVAKIAEYEKLHQEIEQTDPYKYLIYLSTKSSDDRAVMIARFQK